MDEGKRGRKPWIPTPEILEKIEGYASRFLQEGQIARLVGIAPQQFSTKKQEFPEIAEALEGGRAKAAINITNACYEVGVGKKNPNMLQFLAKSVVGLKENDPQIQETINFNVVVGEDQNKFEF